MIDKGKNRLFGIDDRGTKLFSAISLFLVISWLLSLLRYQSNKPGILAGYTASWLALLGVAFVVLGAVSYFNYLIWVRFGRKVDGKKSELTGLWCSWLFIVLLVGLVWVFVGGLVWFHGNLGERGVVNFSEQVVVLGLACSLALINFMKFSDSPRSKFFLALEILVTKKWFHNTMLFALLAFFVFQGVYNGIFWQGMIGDETLDVYAARTIVDGSGPFTNYIILHPPMAYLPTALFIFIGRLFSLDTLIAARVGKLVLFLLSTVLAYISANKLTNNRTLALLGAALIGWTSVFTLISYSSPTKLYVMFFSLVLILFIQYEKWFWVGIVTLLLVLSWGGGFLFLPLPFIILLFGEQKGALKRWGLVIGGFAVVVFLMLFYLQLTNTLDLFYKQYIMGSYELFLSKLGASEYIYSTTDVGLMVRLSRMAGVDRFILFMSVGAVLCYLHRQFEGFITVKKLRWLVSNTTEAPLLLSFVFVLTLSLVDFQSFLDAIPVVVPASLLILVVAKPHINSFSGSTSYRNADLYMKVILIILVLGLARTIQPVKIATVRLDGQIAIAKMIDDFAPDAEFQYLGHLGQLILRDEKNPSRIIHLGPKTMMALEAEGLTLTDYLNEISENDPEFIIVDTRNHELDYLQPVFAELNSTYAFVENPYATIEYRKIYYHPDNTVGQALAYSMILSGQNSALVEANLAAYNGNIQTAIAAYREAIRANWRIVNYSQLEMGKLQYQQGNSEAARENFKFITTIGPFRDLGNLAIGSFFQSIGKNEEAQIYYSGVFSEDIPESFDYQGPDIFGPLELLTVENSINCGVSPTHFLTGYALTDADPDHSLLTLWWYLPDRRGVRDALVAIRWVDEAGDPIKETGVYRTLFYPELGVRWSYLIEKDVVDHAAGFQISLLQDDAESVFGETIFIRKP